MAKTPGRGAAAPVTKPRKAAAAPRPIPVRPNKKYSRKLANKICERLRAGEMWSRIAGRGDMPSPSTFYFWLRTRPAFAEDVNRAREEAADRIADDVLEIARAVTPGSAGADRVRITAMQWSAGKAAPHRYGAKAGEQVGSTGARIIVVRVREFVPVARPDGTLFTREIFPDGSCHDYET